MTEAISKAYKNCNNCGTMIDSTSKYCAFCGFEQKADDLGEDIQVDKVNVKICPTCGETVDRDGAKFCPVCGHDLDLVKEIESEPPQKMSPAVELRVGDRIIASIPARPYEAPPKPATLPPGYVLNGKGKKIHRVTAGVLGIVLGSIGAHWFYIGKPALGVLSVLTSWTGIPALVGIIHGIIYLTSKDEHFKAKYLP
jgi:TM2 domain-containing membrane protein YozV/RNA polymerase subunit RPABC4/transcription elongation factor Spt4